MKELFYSCDAGSVAVNCGGSIIRFGNGIGDCASRIYVADSLAEFEEYQESHRQYFHRYGENDGDEIQFVTLCDFKNAEILDYDCPHGVDECRTGVVLNGRFGIWNWSGKVYFVPTSHDSEEVTE